MPRCGGVISCALALGLHLGGCGEKEPDPAPTDSAPGESAPPDTGGDTGVAEEPHAPTGLNDLVEIAGVVVEQWSLPLVGEFTGDGIPDYVFQYEGPVIMAGPLSEVVDPADDHAVAARLIWDVDGEWTPSGGIGTYATGQLMGDGGFDLVMAGYVEQHGELEGYTTYVYHGPILHDITIGEDPDATISSEDEAQSLGISLSLGDTDGDGRDDLLLGARENYEPTHGEGAAYLFRGPVAGAHDVGEADTTFLGGAAAGGLGAVAELHGDFSGDGLRDAAISAANTNPHSVTGAVVFEGPPPSGAVSAESADTRIVGSGCWWISTTGDIQGDGYDDLVLSDKDSGTVWIFSGPLAPALTAAEASVIVRHSEPILSPFGFGSSSSMEQDLDADGRDDLVVGAPGYWSEDWSGGDYVFYGPLEGSVSSTEADAVIRVAAKSYHEPSFGPGYVSSGGDVNQDGYEDFFTTGCIGHDEDLPCYDRTFAVFGGPR